MKPSRLVQADSLPSPSTSRSPIDRVSRNERRFLLSREQRARRSGEWGEWESMSFPCGSVGDGPWSWPITQAFRNKVFSVLFREAGNGVDHYAVSSLSGERPSWHEMQRIKNELAGPDRTAVEVYPPKAEVVDQADMFHFWVLPEPLNFSIWPHAKCFGDRSKESERCAGRLNQSTASLAREREEA